MADEVQFQRLLGAIDGFQELFDDCQTVAAGLERCFRAIFHLTPYATPRSVGHSFDQPVGPIGEATSAFIDVIAFSAQYVLDLFKKPCVVHEVIRVDTVRLERLFHGGDSPS